MWQTERLSMKDIRQLAREFTRKQQQQTEEQRLKALAKIREIRSRLPKQKEPA